MKLQEPECLLPGKAGNWRSDLGLSVQISSSFPGRGAGLWRLFTGSLDVVLSGGTAMLMTGVPFFLASGSISDGLYLLQMPFLDLPYSFIHGAILLLDEGVKPDFLPVAGDH